MCDRSTPFLRRSCDARWTVCQRPLVHVGAELGRDMLDLRYDAEQGVYHAPPHLQANNGMLVLDDVGRQRIGASELLNRFIGPLDAGCDQLSLNASLGFVASPASPAVASRVTTQIRATADAGKALDALQSVRVTMPEGLSLSPSAGAKPK